MRLREQGPVGVKFRSSIAAALAAFGLLVFSAVPASAEQILAGPGSGDGQVSVPAGMDVDRSTAQLYVADTENQRIDVFDASTGQFTRAFGWGVTGGPGFGVCTSACVAGLSGSQAGQFSRPTRVGVDNSIGSPSPGAVYVVDRNNNRIQKFSSSGAFVLMFGDSVNTTTGGDVCTAASGDACGAGTGGEGPGQFNRVGGVMVGNLGNVYVAETVASSGGQVRVQEYSPAGSLLGQQTLEVPGGAGAVSGLALDSEGNFYVSTSGSTGAVRKFGPTGILIWTRNPSLNVSSLATDSAGHVYVGDLAQVFSGPAEFPPGVDASAAGVINEYDGEGNQVRSFYGALLNKSNVTGLASFTSAGGSIFASEAVASDRVLHISTPPVGPLVYPEPRTILARPIGNVKATLNARVNPEGKAATFHFEYVDQASFELGGWSSPAVERTAESSPVGSDFSLYPAVQQITGLTPDTAYRFRAVVSNADAPAGNPGPETTFETEPPLAFGDIWAAPVGTEAATLHGEVNPFGFAATGFFEYVTDASFQADGFASAAVAPAGPPLEFGDGEELVQRSASIAGLSSGTTYHYRLTASDHCKPAEPLVLCTFESPAQTFTTFAPVQRPPTACSNSAFRVGFGGLLPDCRAYEMVSPVDKNGVNIEAVNNNQTYPAALNQGAAEGKAITYSAYRSFAEPEGAPYSSQYLATRSSSGWRNKSIALPREGPSIFSTASLDYQFKAFTADLCIGWPVQDSANPLLAAGAIPGYPNLYQRDNCEPGRGQFQTITTTLEKPKVNPRNFFPELQGFADDGSKAVYVVAEKLTPNAKAGKAQVYEVSGGEAPKLVCVLPNGGVASQDCSVGMATEKAASWLAGAGAERVGRVDRAVSRNGSRIYWTQTAEGPGKLYVRIDGQETVVVSEQNAGFWTAAADGSRAIYTVGEELFVFDLATRTSTLVASGVKGLAGASEDATQLYFASVQVLDAGATAGKLNLYRYSDGDIRFLGTLSAADAVPQMISPISPSPFLRTSRVTPDGDRFVFMSKASLTGFDNTDAVSGEPDAEVFLYDATANDGAGELRCLSCAATDARPQGANWAPVEFKYGFSESWVAAWIPGWQNQLYAPRVISSDGSRVFFNSFEPLVAADTNGKADVYQWESPGAGDCVRGGPRFVASADGCLSLISSGQSPEASELVDSSTSGAEVFFRTSASLVAQDPGLLDIYAATVDGGFPTPPAPAAECEGESCQSPAPAPEALTPSSSIFVGPGNAVTRPRPKQCPKGKHRVKKKGKSLCVKKQGKKKAKKHSSRRAAR